MILYYEKLTQGSNNLEVRFTSPIKASLEKRNRTNFTPPECPPNRYNGECHMNMLRKMQASFSWDWGPAVPSIGIWKPVSFEVYNTAQIRDITYLLSEDDGNWTIDINVYMELGAQSNARAEGILSAEIM